MGVVMGREIVRPAAGSELAKLFGDRDLKRRFTNVFILRAAPGASWLAKQASLRRPASKANHGPTLKTAAGDATVINALHWDEVVIVDQPWLPARTGRLLTLLPGPADHDVCLREAGFDDFGDTDDLWDAMFSSVVNRVFEYGASHGHARLMSGDVRAYASRAAGKSPAPAIADAMICAATDDRFPPCQVEFGDPSAVAVRTSQGHPVVWLWERSPSLASDGTVALLAQGLPIRRTRLRWSVLEDGASS
jgi:hypothetical protein